MAPLAHGDKDNDESTLCVERLRSMKQNERRMRGGWLGVTATAASFILAMSVAFAGGAPPPRTDEPPPVHVKQPIVPGPTPVASAQPPNRIPLPVMTLAPAGQLCAGLNLKSVPEGTRVPLSCLPRLPQRSSANTRTPMQSKAGHLHPMAASGATIDLTSGAGCGSNGALYAVGCSLTWQATNNTDWANSTYQDYVIPPNATTATATGGTYANNASTAHVTVMSVQGTYTFLVYDTVAKVIASVVYANTGAPFTIGVYQDPYHTQQAYQFDAQSNPTVYIFLPSVSTTDVYVAEVMSTAVNSYCVYLTPNGVPAPPLPSPRPTGAANSLVCNPTTSAGISAPSGTLSLQWPINSNYQAGTYSILIYDKTVGATLGQVQVSVTGIYGYTFQLYPTPGAAPTPAAFVTPPTTTFAWDSTVEQSTAGIVAAVANQIGTAPTNGIYRMTVTDPDGQVVGIPVTNVIPNTCTSLVNSSPTCTVNGTFTFAGASPALHAPGNYPNNTWTIQLYAPNNTEAEASQYFQIKGYSLETQFNIPTEGGIGQSMSFGNSGGAQTVAASLIFTNTANIKYPFAPDPLVGIEYVASSASGTGAPLCSTNFLNASFKPPARVAGCGGVTIVPAGCTGAQLNSAAGCVVNNVPDSTGGTWTLTDWCSTNNPTNPANTDLCVLRLLPNGNTDLVGGASITVGSLTFYAQGGSGGWPCYFTPCTSPTSILPLDGLSWSSQLSTSPAWTPVYYGSVAGAIEGAASAHYIGSATFPGNTSRNAPGAAPTATPYPAWINTHFYPAQFAQGEYQTTTPFQAAAGTEDILVINLSSCNGLRVPATVCPTSPTSSLTMGEVEITFPSGINASQITVDPSEPTLPTGRYYAMATGGGAGGCVNTPPSNGICLNPNSTTPTVPGSGSNTSSALSAGQQGQIWLDVPASQASYLAQELQVQAYSPAQLYWQTLLADTSGSTPVVGGGVSGTMVDSLSLQGFSLNANLMGTQFNPSTVSPSGATTSYSLVFTNTLKGADPNADPVDAVVIEQTTSNAWNLSAPSITGTTSTGWTAPSGIGYKPGGTAMEYWFTACGVTNYNINAAGPPQVPPAVTNPSSAQTALTPASCANSKNAIAPGGSLTFNFTLADNTLGTKTFYVFAHGANGGGWANLKTITVTSTSETGSAKVFSVAQGSTDAACSTTSNVATNTVAQVAKAPVCFIYEVTNTSSGVQNIGQVDIHLPAYDINGLATGTGPPIDWSLVGAPITQYVVLGHIVAGSFVAGGAPAGCAINAAATVQPVPGSSDGIIEVKGCTAFTPAAGNIAVEFVSNTPQVQSNSYLLPAYIDGTQSGNAWVGSDEVTVAFSLGLSVTVDPGNPGPGGSHPSPACVPAQCAFSGSVLDFGTIPAFSTVTGTDVVRTTVVYEGATLSATCPAGAPVSANTWQVSVAVSSNPFNELFTEADNTNSTPLLSYNAASLAWFNPGAGGQVISCGGETSGTNYDTIMNFKTTPSETTGHVVTVTYTLISN